MSFIQENVALNLSVTQSIPTINEQMMKTTLHTFTCKQILRKLIKKLLKYQKKSKNQWAKMKTHHNMLSFRIYDIFFCLQCYSN